ncbi:MAG TPA: acyl-ACP desaturase [Pyrinomonadaceae bacterium]|jgi:rubrerythrin
MSFETKREVLEWYERQPRALTAEFIGSIAWRDIKNYELDGKFVPVLLYMRDVETLTDMYYRELRRTPTGKDPYIGKFMERWSAEEITHGEVLNRFLNEAGVETGAKWKERVHESVSRVYKANAYLLTTLTNLIGERFTATHMTFGAIHELSTAQGYRRLMKLANHPVLTEILTAIMREESAHTRFYANVARIELGRSSFARRAARFIVNRFYAPVGQGARPKKQTAYTIGTLFDGKEGFEWIERNVARKIQALPGFDGLTKITDAVAEIQAVAI